MAILHWHYLRVSTREIFRVALICIMNNPLAAAIVQQIITRNVLAAQNQRQHLEQQPPQNRFQPQHLIQTAQLQQQLQGLSQFAQLPIQILHAQQQQIIQSLNNLRNQQIEESYSFLNSDSFHSPPPQHLQPPAGSISSHLHSQSSAGQCEQIPSSTLTQPVRRKSTNTESAPQDTDERRETNVRSTFQQSEEETRKQPAEVHPRRIALAARTLRQTSVSTSKAGSGISRIAPPLSRTPSPTSSIGSAGTATSQMTSYSNDNTYGTGNANGYSYGAGNSNSYNTGNNSYMYNTGNSQRNSNSYNKSDSNKGMKRQNDEYYEQWDDPSPAKRSRGNEVNHVPSSGSNRNNLLSVNVVTRDRYQNNRNVKEVRPIEDVRVPPPHVASTPDQKITNHIWQHFLDKQQTQDAYQKKMRLREALYSVTKGIFPYCGLYMVGSSMSGFGSVYSDLDMCLMLSHKAIDQKKEATDILVLLLKSLRKCSFIKQMELIRARVPILKFRDKIANVECDLNVNNAVGIRNTHLLGAYSRMDWRVRPLVLFTKHWAQFHDINDARKMTISSYSLSMMVLHYLQCGSDPPVLPSLHKLEPDKYNSERDVRTLSLTEMLPEFQTKNSETLAELFLGFLEYYACKFDYEKDVISIRLGTKIPKHVVARQSFQGPAAQWKFLCIEEPFDLSNTSRSVFDQFTFMRILQVFKVSHRRLQSTRNIMSLFDHPF